MRTIITTAILTLLIATASFAANITLQWDDPNPPGTIAGYKLYQQSGPSTAPFVLVQTLLPTLREAVVPDRDKTKAYSFYVTAFDAAGNESDPSNAATSPAVPKSVVLKIPATISVTITTGDEVTK